MSKKAAKWMVFGCMAAIQMGCASAYRKELREPPESTFSRIYVTDFKTAWQSTLEALKSSRLDIANREAGFIQTRFTENTAEKNFIDSYGTAESFLKAQIRYRIVVAKGTFEGKDGVRVSVVKDQQVQRDLLEGWKPVETDSIDENTLLYRVGRLIWMRVQVAKIEDSRSHKAMDAASGGT